MCPSLPSHRRASAGPACEPLPSRAVPRVWWGETDTHRAMDIDTRVYTRSTVVLGRSSLRNVLRKGFFSPSPSAVAPNGEQLRPWGKPTPQPGHAKLPRPGCEGPGGAGQPRSSVGYQLNMVQGGTPKDRGSLLTPGPDEVKVSRGRSPLARAQPLTRPPHGTGLGYRCPPWNQQLVVRAALRAGRAVPDGAQLPLPAAGPATDSSRLPGWGQRGVYVRNPAAAEWPQARSGSALPPLSPARSLPPLGGSARTRHSMQRAMAGEDKRVLAGSYRERRYCSIAKRLSPAALSFPSFFPSPPLSCRPLPPAPPPPAAPAAADSRRSPAGEGRKRVITPGPLPRPARSATARPTARATRGARPPCPPLRPGTGRQSNPGFAGSPGRALKGPPYLSARERQLRRLRPSLLR